MVKDFLLSTEFWMGLSAVAAVLPGPQTRLLPAFFKAIAEALAAYRSKRG